MATHQLRSRRAALIAALLGSTAFCAGVAHADVSYIPIPEIITDPNEGNTFGALGVALITDDTDRVTYMIAPDVRYNKTKGVFPTFRLFGYPDPKRSYSLTIGKSTTKDEDFEGEYHDNGLMDGRGYLHAVAIYERDSTERFYGFGNQSSEFAESNYTSSNFHAWVNPGYFVLPNLSIGYRMRIRRFEMLRGQVDSQGVTDLIECTRLPHPSGACPPSPDTPGLTSGQRRLPGVRSSDFGPGVYWAHRIALTYDSRDVIDIPTEGSYANFYAEMADRRLGSESSFAKFGGEWRAFIPFREVKNPILALRGVLDYISGDRSLPFWEQNDLGGRRRLRAFGSNRFIDFNRSLATAELRTRVYQRHVFGVDAELEIAPFLEAGQVFHDINDSPVNDLHWVGGLGFRGVVRPQIVGFVDVGRGSEGVAIFTGIDYPF